MIKFEQIITLLKEYKEKYGDCLVPKSYVTESGIRLGRIVKSIRTGKWKTSETEKEVLNKLGFVWKLQHSFEEVTILLKEYKEKYGDCLVPYSYVTEKGVRLGNIVHSIRTGTRKTSEIEKAKLNKLGFVWKVQYGLPFEEVTMLLREYKKNYGDCLVPRSYVTENGVCLGSIVHCIRTGTRKTSETEKQILNKLGFVWKCQLPFNEILTLLKEYKEKYGDCLVPKSYVTESGIRLGRIVKSIRTGKWKTSETEKEELNKLGFVWKIERALQFEKVTMLLKEYKEKYGDCLVPVSYVTESGIRLGLIVSSIRAGNRKTSEVEKEELNKLGFVWKVYKK